MDSAPKPIVLIQSLRGDLCPMCAKSKRPAQTMCPACYAKLPGQLKKDLYKRVGAGYEQAVEAAMTSLGVTEFRIKALSPSPG
jgi:hypothetical protein